MITDRERKNREELFKLMQENPERHRRIPPRRSEGGKGNTHPKARALGDHFELHHQPKQQYPPDKGLH